MKKIKLIFYLVSLIFIGCFSIKFYKADIRLENVELENISFVDILKNKIIYTKNNMTFVYENKKEKNLNKNIIKKISNFYLYQDNNKLGLLNKNFEVILPAKFDEIYDSNLNNKVIVKDNKKMYIYDLKNKNLGKGYDYITSANKLGLLKIKKAEKYGYINSNFEEIIPTEYDVLFDFKGNNCIAKTKDGWGIINDKNENLTNFENQEVYLHDNGNYILKKSDNKYVDSKGREYSNIRLFPSLSNYIVYEKADKFGVFDLENLKEVNKLYPEIGLYISKGMIVSNGEKYDVVIPLNLDEPTYGYDYVTQIDKNIYGIGSNETGKLKFFSVENFYKSNKEFEDIKIVSKNLYACLDEDIVEFYTNIGELILKDNKKNLVFINDEYIVYKYKNMYKILELKERRR